MKRRSVTSSVNKSRKKTQVPDVPKENVESNHNSLSSTEGLPIKLVYKPKKPDKQTIASAKKTAWKLTPEFVFMVSSFISTLLAAYYVMMAASVIAWKDSIASVLSDSSDLLGGSSDHTPDQIRLISESLAENKYYLKRQGFLTGHGVAVAMIISSLLSVFNTIVGWRAAVLALRFQLAFHRWFDLPMLVSGMLAIAWIFSTNDCMFENDIFERSMLDNFMNYGELGRSDAVIDGIQEALGCCGVHGPLDYIDSGIRLTSMSAATRDEGAEFVFPSTCCREWWIRNVHCAANAHNFLREPSDLHNRILFSETIHQTGCTERVYDVCDQFMSSFKIGMPICTVLYLIHIIIKYFTVVQMLREESATRVKANQEVRKDGKLGFPLWSDGNSLQSSDEEEEEWMKTNERIPGSRRTVRKEYTQDDIHNLKERAQFAEIEAKLATSYLGKLVEEARDTSAYATERPDSDQSTEDIEETELENESPYPQPPPKTKKKKKKKKVVVEEPENEPPSPPPPPPPPPPKIKKKKKKKKKKVIEEVEEVPEPQPEPEPEPEDIQAVKKRKYRSPYTHYTWHWHKMEERLKRDALIEEERLENERHERLLALRNAARQKDKEDQPKKENKEDQLKKENREDQPKKENKEDQPKKENNEDQPKKENNEGKRKKRRKVAKGEVPKRVKRKKPLEDEDEEERKHADFIPRLKSFHQRFPIRRKTKAPEPTADKPRWIGRTSQ